MTDTEDFDLLMQILAIDSTTGSERALADYLADRFKDWGCAITLYESCPGDAAKPANLLCSWGRPRVVFCTHLDTVPPYLPPRTESLPDGDIIFRGRGTCDANGQIWAMAEACRRLAAEGCSGMALMLLHGEETGSYGAKEMNSHPGADYVIVGEPTDNCMVAASKGTKSFDVTVIGRSCHSGYPDKGVSAVDLFVDLINRLRAIAWPVDPELGPTTFNVGLVESPNPQNILSPRLTCRIYFRTTFASDDFVSQTMAALESPQIHVEARGGDTPMRYLTLPGFDTTTVAFGSDAPQLKNFRHRILCGPGSILVAHTPDEYVLASDLRRAVEQYVRMFHLLANNT